MQSLIVPTEGLMACTTRDFSAIADEPVTVEFIGGAVYVFGSELACLRVFYKYRRTPGACIGHSPNRRTWYYCHDTPAIGDS